MAIDEYARQQRRRYLGSSDAAAIFKRDPWRGPYDVYAEKCGLLKPDTRKNEPAEAGHYLEGGILSWTEDTLGRTLSRDQALVHPNEIMAANLDALALDKTPALLVEAKSCGLFGRPEYYDDFGEPGTNQVPGHILLQVHHQFAVLEAQTDLPTIELAIVPALLVRRGFVLYRVPKNQSLVDAIREGEVKFWREFIEPGIAPPDDLPSMDTITRLIREPEKVVDMDPGLVDEWLRRKEAAKALAQDEETARRAVLAALGDAEAGTLPDGSSITYLEQSRQAYEVGASTFRVLRHKAAKGAAKKERRTA